MAIPSEVSAVVSAFEGLSSEANKKLCISLIWAYMYANYRASAIQNISEDILADVRNNPNKYNIVFIK